METNLTLAMKLVFRGKGEGGGDGGGERERRKREKFYFPNLGFVVNREVFFEK